MTNDAAQAVGDIGPQEAFRLLSERPDAVLVDVRTDVEWAQVGAPDLGSIGKDAVFLSWQTYPTMAVAPDFVEKLEAELAARGAAADTPILFICRSGARSLSAATALAATGSHTNLLNVVGGFEGKSNPPEAREAFPGWRATGLPWSHRG